MTFLVIFLLATLILYIWLNWYTSKTQKMYKQFPGPKPYPIVGNIFEFMKRERTEVLTDLCSKYWPLFLLRMGTEHIVCLQDPSDIEDVFSHTDATLDKPAMFDTLVPWIGRGIFSCQGETWKKDIKLITPAYHFKVLESFIPVFDKNSQKFAETLLKREGEEIDVFGFVNLWQFENVIGTMMGAKPVENGEEIVDALKQFLDIKTRRDFSVLYRSFIFPYLPTGRKHGRLVAKLKDFSKKVLEERRLVRNSTSTKSGHNKENGAPRRKPIIDMLLDYQEEGRGLTDQYIIDQISTVLLGGVDTVGSTTSFILYLLSQNPDIQEKAFKEVQKVFGDSERLATYQDLQELRYIDNVIKETGRLYGGITVIRKITQDIQMKRGYTIPKGTTVSALMEAVHKNPSIYPEPQKFLPERFDQQKKAPFLFFGVGIRNCIGKRYAMMSMKFGVSHILRKIQLLPSDIPLNLKHDLVLKSTTGINVRIKRRKALREIP